MRWRKKFGKGTVPLVTCAILWAATAPAAADTEVLLDYKGYSGANVKTSVTGNTLLGSGLIEWEDIDADDEPSNETDFGTVYTMCVQTNQILDDPTLFNFNTLEQSLIDSNLATESNAGDKALLIHKIWYANYDDAAYTSDYTVTGVKDNTKAAALQLAIWEAIHDFNGTYELNEGDTARGNFYITYANRSGLEAEAETMINNGLAYSDLMGKPILSALSSDSGQDQAMLVGFTTDPLPPAFVPLPAAAWPCVGLLAGVVGWKKYRGRKIEAA